MLHTWEKYHLYTHIQVNKQKPSDRLQTQAYKPVIDEHELEAGAAIDDVAVQSATTAKCRALILSLRYVTLRYAFSL